MTTAEIETIKQRGASDALRGVLHTKLWEAKECLNLSLPSDRGIFLAQLELARRKITDAEQLFKEL